MRREFLVDECLDLMGCTDDCASRDEERALMEVVIERVIAYERSEPWEES